MFPFSKMNKSLFTYSLIFLILIFLFGFNFFSEFIIKLPLLQVGQFALPLIGFSLMALLLQALLPSRKVPLRPLIPGSILIGIGLTTLNLAVSKSILSLGTRFQAYGFIGGFLVLTLWVWLLGVNLYFGQCWRVVIALSLIHISEPTRPY